VTGQVRLVHSENLWGIVLRDNAVRAAYPEPSETEHMPLKQDSSSATEHFQLLVLATLRTAPKHGRVISKEIAAFLGHDPGPGTVYGALYRLVEKKHIIRLPMDGRRQPFEITRAGLASLTAQTIALQSVVQFVSTALSHPSLRL
jgi:DNA-binding PadR family transcriptional regulator